MTAVARRLDARSLQTVIEGLHLLAGAAERVDAEQRKAAPPMALDADPLVEMMARRARARSGRPKGVKVAARARASCFFNFCLIR